MKVSDARKLDIAKEEIKKLYFWLSVPLPNFVLSAITNWVLMPRVLKRIQQEEQQ